MRKHPRQTRPSTSQPVDAPAGWILRHDGGSSLWACRFPHIASTSVPSRYTPLFTWAWVASQASPPPKTLGSTLRSPQGRRLGIRDPIVHSPAAFLASSSATDRLCNSLCASCSATPDPDVACTLWALSYPGHSRYPPLPRAAPSPGGWSMAQNVPTLTRLRLDSPPLLDSSAATPPYSLSLIRHTMIRVRPTPRPHLGPRGRVFTLW